MVLWITIKPNRTSRAGRQFCRISFKSNSLRNPDHWNNCLGNRDVYPWFGMGWKPTGRIQRSLRRNSLCHSNLGKSDGGCKYLHQHPSNQTQTPGFQRIYHFTVICESISLRRLTIGYHILTLQSLSPDDTRKILRPFASPHPIHEQMLVQTSAHVQTTINRRITPPKTLGVEV